MAKDIEIKIWARRGMMLVRTEALEANDPEHPYNQALAQGATPEAYGIRHPLDEERRRFWGKSRGELIDHILKLEEELTALLKYV